MSQYELLGQAVAIGLSSGNLLSEMAAARANIINLYSFHNGGALDTQAFGGSTAYANYVYGVYMAAAGYSLQQTLGGADLYASMPWKYRGRPPSFFDANYTNTPTANVTNITNGYNAETAGKLPCPPI
jgi:hypothetical protein